VATGTGIAPFVSMARAGVSGFILLHGVRVQSELYYAKLFELAAKGYIPCLSGNGGTSSVENQFSGRVTDYLKRHLPPDDYDFYLCGRNDMIRDVTLLVDDCFPGSRVYSEIFY
jgi:NAD(P)H-flavin reductase